MPHLAYPAMVVERSDRGSYDVVFVFALPSAEFLPQ